MEDFFLQPLEFAVFDVIANSHLTNPDYSFLTAFNVDKIGYMENPKFPYVVCNSGLDQISDDKAVVGLTVAIVIPFPDMQPDDLPSTRYFKATGHAADHQQSLVEILQWLTGKNKLTNGRKLYDFDMVQATFPPVDYDPVLGDGDKLRTHVNDPSGKLNRTNHIIVIGMDVTFKGYYQQLCCQKFNPQSAGENWKEKLAQF